MRRLPVSSFCESLVSPYQAVIPLTVDDEPFVVSSGVVRVLVSVGGKVQLSLVESVVLGFRGFWWCSRVPGKSLLLLELACLPSFAYTALQRTKTVVSY